jgi:hypothetical protein
MRGVTFVAVLSLLLFGCPRGRQEEPPQTSTTTANPQAVPENSTAMNPVTPPQKETPSSRPATAEAPADVDVQLTEYEIRMPDSLPAGTHRFRITNSGKVNHSFAVEGPGVSMKLMNDLPRGDSSEMTADLQPGRYTAWCPVDGHRGKGMERKIAVTTSPVPR